MCKTIITLLFLSSVLISFSTGGYMFRLQLKDKGQTVFSISKPEEFLSERAIERRQRQDIAIDESDYPISLHYISTIEQLGGKVVARSKWLSTVSVYCEDSVFVDELKKLPFVADAKFVWRGDTATAPPISKSNPLMKRVKILEKSATDYGYAYDQIRTVNGHYLHEQGYRGKGMEIAVIDAGYKNLNDILLLDNTTIRGMKDFVYRGENMFRSSDHGLKVFSILAANRQGTFVGTAPDAKYWLFRSEDGRSEYPIEEDYWVTATEYADSIGVDVINTSLGYYKFNNSAESYTSEQLDGKTAYISKAAAVASSKGIFVEISAGNEGFYPWKKIVFPADVESVLSVGSMTRDSLVSTFSSVGPSFDDRVKPDVVALGSFTNVIASDGEVEQTSGTSFAGPIMSGLSACLWQAYPELTNLELLDVIRKSAHKYDTPGYAFGYGIPDMNKAMAIAKEIVSAKEEIP